MILRLFGESNWWKDTLSDVELMCRSYFKGLFQSSGPSIEDFEVVLEQVQLRVTAEMVANLYRPFTTIEVKSALWHMHPNKSPDPNRFSSFFF